MNPNASIHLVGKSVSEVSVSPTRSGGSIDTGDFEVIIVFSDGSRLRYMQHLNMIQSSLIMEDVGPVWSKQAVSQR